MLEVSRSKTPRKNRKKTSSGARAPVRQPFRSLFLCTSRIRVHANLLDFSMDSGDIIVHLMIFGLQRRLGGFELFLGYTSVLQLLGSNLLLPGMLFLGSFCLRLRILAFLNEFASCWPIFSMASQFVTKSSNDLEPNRTSTKVGSPSR